tara:strand:+ start:104 stop:511 length:408 start_codon:yes stop_codon:yes gene_type:complete
VVEVRKAVTKLNKMKVEIELEYEMFENIIVTALEGGSNYWYVLGDIKGCKKMPHKAESERIAYGLWHNKESKVCIHDVEDGELLGTLTQDRVREGLALGCGEHMEEIGMMMDGKYDAWTADTLFQILVMGEIVYG